MILYAYICDECGLEFEASKAVEDRHFAECPKCQSQARLIIVNVNSRDWFKPHYSEHFDPNKEVFVKSREHFKELCKDYKVYSRALGPIDDRRGC